VLRQDPDIIMVGEIRDHETAELAIQSALTGHLVFSTLHTNDAASAVTRLLDLGVEPYLVASSLVAVMAQRLVRTVCPGCGEPTQVTEAQWRSIGCESSGLAAVTPKAGGGCTDCRGTGYRGRLGLFELLTPDEAIRGHIQAVQPAGVIKSTAVAQGMKTLQEDGQAKVAAGRTTVDEVLRVTTRAAL
jgi:general secretion pathway protein E